MVMEKFLFKFRIEMFRWRLSQMQEKMYFLREAGIMLLKEKSLGWWFFRSPMPNQASNDLILIGKYRKCRKFSSTPQFVKFFRIEFQVDGKKVFKILVANWGKFWKILPKVIHYKEKCIENLKEIMCGRENSFLQE